MKKALKKFIESEGYQNWSIHFSYISGFLTIIGLAYGIVSYHQTVKPLVDEKRLKQQVEELEIQNDILDAENLLLGETKTNLNNKLSKLEERRNNLESELQSTEEQLRQLQDELFMANADAYMEPIIYKFLYSSVISGEKNSVKEKTLEKLTKLSRGTSITDSKRDTLDTLINFVNEKLNQSSDYNDLLSYRIYIFEQNLKEMGIITGE